MLTVTVFWFQVIDAIAASQQETGTLNLDFFRDHASPSWKTDDLVDHKMNTSLDVDDKAKAENSTAEHDLSLTYKPPKDGSGIDIIVFSFKLFIYINRLDSRE
jgi:alpha-1,4-galacturonosyltransferase